MDAKAIQGDYSQGSPSDFSYPGFLLRVREAGFRVSSYDLPRHLYFAYGPQRIEPYIQFLERAELPVSARTLEAVSQLIDFDERMGMLILRWIGVVQMQVKSQYCQVMLDAFGPYCLYEKDCFRNEKDRVLALRSIEFERRKFARNTGAGKVRLAKGKRVPIWEAAEAASFGLLRSMYCNTSAACVVNRVSASFDVGSRCFKSWLRLLVRVRNCCAHFNPYVVRSRPLVASKLVAGFEGDAASPLYVLVVLDRLLQGRARVGSMQADNEWRAFRREAGQLAGAFAWQNPRLAVALRIPFAFMEEYAAGLLPDVHVVGGRCRKLFWVADLAA